MGGSPGIPAHVCREPSLCCCRITADEPSEDCPVHGGGPWPPRCETCGKFMRRESAWTQERKEYAEGEEGWKHGE